LRTHPQGKAHGQAHLSFLANHPFSVVFWSSLIEAAGIPFPSRVILILTPAFLATESDLVWLIIVATIGALLGDHVYRTRFLWTPG
jgi:membrane protein DedA with SNARE-associated domain